MPTANVIDLEVLPEEQELALAVKAHVDQGLKFLERAEFEPAILAFKQAVERSPNGSPAQDVAKHNLLSAYAARIGELLRAGEPLSVNRYLPEVTALDLTSPLRDDPEFRGKFAKTFVRLGTALNKAEQHEVGAFMLRRAIAIHPSPNFYIDLANTLARLKAPARLSDFTTAYPPSELGNHIFVTCTQKSGSTFLKNVLRGVTGYQEMFSVFASLQNEQELNLPHFIEYGRNNTVTQQHARASEPNIQVMQAFGVRPVVLVRNIFDSAVSLLDFYTKGYAFSSYFEKEEFTSFDEAKRIDLLIKYALPWYFQFVASWQRAEREGRLEMHWVTFEEMLADKVGTVRRILDFYGVEATDQKILDNISQNEEKKRSNRINKGVSGRGKTVLTEEQRERIADLAVGFPSADFSIIGL